MSLLLLFKSDDGGSPPVVVSTPAGGGGIFAEFEYNRTRKRDDEEVLDAVELIKEHGTNTERKKAKSLERDFTLGKDMVRLHKRIVWAMQLAEEFRRRDDDEIAVVLMMIH